MPGPILKSAALAAFASAALAAPAYALVPPPLSVPVTVVSDDAETQAIGEAMVTVLHHQGWFGKDAPRIDRSSLIPCMREAEGREDCIRKAQGWKGSGAAVVILASGTAEQEWQCIGVAEAAKYPDRQSVRIKMQNAFFGEQPERKAARDDAARCIIAAGAESGW